MVHVGVSMCMHVDSHLLRFSVQKTLGKHGGFSSNSDKAQLANAPRLPASSGNSC